MSTHARRVLRAEQLETRSVLSSLPLTAVPELDSYANSAHTLYLDFNGHTAEDTWYNGGVQSGPALETIHARAFDQDGDASSFTQAELNAIESIWSRVAEDFSMFDINVSTREPALSAFEAGGEAMRIVFSDRFDAAELGGTGMQWASSALGGVAGFLVTQTDFVNETILPDGNQAWQLTNDHPVWVFNSNPVEAGNTATHEAGHGFGLLHNSIWDGTDRATYVEYYEGHSVAGGGYSWSPHMGSGSSFVQWTLGVEQYTNSLNIEPRAPFGSFANGAPGWQDQVEIIASQIGFRPDDHGDTLSISGTTTLNGENGILAGSGIIGQRTDVDVFSLVVAEGDRVTLHARPHLDGPSVNLKMEIFDSMGALLATSSPGDSLAAYYEGSLPAGDYLVRIDGVGEGVAPDAGYTDYGSLGMYELTGSTQALATTVAASWSFDQAGGFVDIESSPIVDFEFSNSVGTSFTLSDIVVRDSTGNSVDTSSAVLSQLPRTLTDAAADRYRLELAGVGFQTGDLTIELNGGSIQSASGAVDGDGDGSAGGLAVFPLSASRFGDVNRDGFVDGIDFQVIYRNIGTNGTQDLSLVEWQDGNLNGDLRINNADLNLWASVVPEFALLGAQFDGDFTQDGVIDGRDVDYLYQGIFHNFASGLEQSVALDLYDLDGNSTLNTGDVAALLLILDSAFGDADMDGDVDLVDLNIVGANMGSTDSRWGLGDFDGDGDTDQDDFDILSANFGYGT